MCIGEFSMKDVALIILNTLMESSREPRVADDWQESIMLPFLGEKILVIWNKEKMTLRNVKYYMSKMEKQWDNIQKNIGIFYDTASKRIKKKLLASALTDEKDKFIKRMIPHHITFTGTRTDLVLGDFVIRQILNCDLEVFFNDVGDPILNRIHTIGNC